MSSKRQPPTRLGLDARGNPRTETPTKTGEYEPAPIESTAIRKLKAEQLSLAETRRQRILTNNPYAHASAAKSLKSRSRLDYMRALSEAIKTKRQVKPD